MDKMTTKKERDKRHNWKHSSPEIIKVIKSKSKKKWIKEAVNFVYECHTNKKLPFLSSFWRERDIWIYALRQDIGANKYRDVKHDEWLNKYWMIKDILDEGMQENVVQRNIDKSTFAAFFLANQYKWRTTERAEPAAITFNLTNFTLPTPNSPSPIQIDSRVIEQSTLSDGTLPSNKVDSASQPTLEPYEAGEQADIPVDIDSESQCSMSNVIGSRDENLPNDTKKGGKVNREKCVGGGATCEEYTDTCPSLPENSQLPIDKELIDIELIEEVDSLPIPTKEKDDILINEKEEVDMKKIKNEKYEEDIFFIEED